MILGDFVTYSRRNVLEIKTKVFLRLFFFRKTNKTYLRIQDESVFEIVFLQKTNKTNLRTHLLTSSKRNVLEIKTKVFSSWFFLQDLPRFCL